MRSGKLSSGIGRSVLQSLFNFIFLLSLIGNLNAVYCWAVCMQGKRPACEDCGNEYRSGDADRTRAWRSSQTANQPTVRKGLSIGGLHPHYKETAGGQSLVATCADRS